MTFNSPIFIFIFLPVFILLALIMPKKFRNIILVLASLIFYSWGEPKFVLLLIFCIIINYLCALSIHTWSKDPIKAKIWLIVALTFNISILVSFKYFDFILADAANKFFDIFTDASHLQYSKIALPLGISFYIFSAISYIIDIYRDKDTFDRNPINTALYLAFFPKLLAGPIVQYLQFKNQINNHTFTIEKIYYGIQRFIIGLGKKVLVADTLGTTANQIFSLNPDQLSLPISWLGIICFTLQIYFDFSGYSDMAIGIGRIVGFDLGENFNYPYISKSIREFWRRWHISLSSWFRDYLYIPLGGNRGSKLRVTLNIFIVFILCGLWHGNGWTFLIWGLWYSCFIAIEHTRLGKLIDNALPIFRHVYTLLVIIIGWVFFKASSLTFAILYLKSMSGLIQSTNSIPINTYLSNLLIVTLIAGLIFAMPIQTIFISRAKNILSHFTKRDNVFDEFNSIAIPLFTMTFLGLILTLSIMSISHTTSNAFIYFSF